MHKGEETGDEYLELGEQLFGLGVKVLARLPHCLSVARDCKLLVVNETGDGK